MLSILQVFKSLAYLFTESLLSSYPTHSPFLNEGWEKLEVPFLPLLAPSILLRVAGGNGLAKI